MTLLTIMMMKGDQRHQTVPPMYKIIWRIHLIKIVETLPRIQLRMVGITLLNHVRQGIHQDNQLPLKTTPVSTISCRAYCKNYLHQLGEKLNNDVAED